MSKFDVSDYVDVRERIRKFYDKYPEGSLQSQVLVHEPDRVTVMATAYRTPDDKRPGIGHSSLTIPGDTSFTRGSELENAETSAWGRAIVSLGFADHRPLASAQEVANKQPAQEKEASPAPAPKSVDEPPPRTPEEDALLVRILAVPGMSKQRMTDLANGLGIPRGTHASAEQLAAILEAATASPWPRPDSAAFNAMSAYERATARAWRQKHEKRAPEVTQAPAK